MLKIRVIVRLVGGTQLAKGKKKEKHGGAISGEKDSMGGGGLVLERTPSV